MFTPDECRQYLLSTLRSLGQDRSWRVRYMVATHFNELCEALGESITREEMVALFVGLIKDSEGEVKILSIGQAPGNNIHLQSFHTMLYNTNKIVYSLLQID